MSILRRMSRTLRCIFDDGGEEREDERERERDHLDARNLPTRVARALIELSLFVTRNFLRYTCS